MNPDRLLLPGKLLRSRSEGEALRETLPIGWNFETSEAIGVAEL